MWVTVEDTEVGTVRPHRVRLDARGPAACAECGLDGGQAVESVGDGLAFGAHLTGETTYVRPTLDLDDAEAADARPWPPVTVAAYQSSTGPVCVLVEVGPAGPPTRFTPDQARRLSTALLDAAAIAEDA